MNIKHLKYFFYTSSILFGFLFTGSLSAASQQANQNQVIAFQNVRLITATDLGVLENATLLVQGDQILQVGQHSQVDTPPGTIFIDMKGKTIVPAFIDTHVHTNQAAPDLLRDLKQLAWFGVGTVASLGVDVDDAAYSMRRSDVPGAAYFLTAGRGITAPEIGRETAPFWVETEAEARNAVRANQRRGVDLIKIWVDDRNGRVPKLSPELYGAVIDEAHQHSLTVTAHIYNLSDAKSLLRANVDAFAHSVRDQDIDDEFMALLDDHPVVLNPNLPARGTAYEFTWLSNYLSTDELEQLNGNQVASSEARQNFNLQAGNLMRMFTHGVPIVLGTDTSFDFPNGDKPWAVHMEMEDMVIAGMPPMDVLLSATRNAASFLGLTERGQLKQGMSADFVILDDNPLDDIRNTRKISAVYLRGAPVDRSGRP